MTLQWTVLKNPEMKLPSFKDDLLEGRAFDVIIIGGGITGVTAAREFSRYNLKIALLEKESDLGLHASGRNDGMIHPGMAARPGSLKAKYNVRGNELYTRASEELDFKLERPGSLLLFSSVWSNLLSPVLSLRCRKNGVPGAKHLSRRKVAEMEPFLASGQKGALFMPTAGIVSPMEVVLAYGENAAHNGVEFFFDTAVTGFEISDGRITGITTNRGRLEAGLVINAAGIWADRIAEGAGDRFFSIHPRKGVDAILDKKKRKYQKHIAGMPSLIGSGKSHSKGGGIVPCVEGNILIGPTAREVLDREDFTTSREEMEELKHHFDLNSRLDYRDIITYYAGTRAATWEEDFVVGLSERIENLIHAAGMQSPGLASAPAVAEDIVRTGVEVLSRKMTVEKNPRFNPVRKSPPKPSELSPDEKETLIARDPAYGRIVCRCEEISEGEVRDALRGPLPAGSVDGIKRRTRAGAGRCHGGFCLERVMEIIAGDKGIELDGVNRNGEDSWILTAREEYCEK